MGHRNIVALGHSAKETATYGKFLGQSLRHIANKDTMRSAGRRVTEIHYLPGWNKRRDRHAIASVVSHIRRQRRTTPLIEKHIIRLPDGRFVDQDYRGPELGTLESVQPKQQTQLEGLRQMHVPDQVEEAAYEDIQDALEEHDAEIVHLPTNIDAEEAAEEQGIDPETEEFFDFLERKD